MNTSIFSDINWLKPNQALPVWELNDTMRSWLLDPGSLTLRLQACATDFNVEVLSHAVASLSLDEAQLSGSIHETDHQVREVLLRDQQTPWVFARSVIPQATDGLLHELQNIGNRPLGQALFNHPAIVPGDFELARFSAPSRMAQMNTHLTGDDSTVYGRRRIFWVGQTPVLVAEVFLTPAPCYNLNTES